MINDKYKTFLLLAQHKTFTETAKRLFCSQPTVTQHIKQLEKELNCELIHRKKNPVELTAQGKILLHYINQMQGIESEMHNNLNQSLQGENMTLYISHYIASNFFCELFDGKNTRCQQCPYEINSFCYEELKQCLFEKKAKFAIMPLYDKDESIRSNFNIEVLFEEELVLVIPKNHPLAHRQTIYARDLKNLPILLPQSFYLSQLIKQAIDEKNIAVYYMQMTNFDLIKKAVQHELGVSFLPKKMMDSGEDQLLYKKVKGLTIKRKNGIVSNRDLPLSILEKEFCHHIVKSLTLKSS